MRDEDSNYYDEYDNESSMNNTFLGEIILLLIFTVKIILMMKIYIQKH